MRFINSLVKSGLEAIAFLALNLIIFNEFATFIQFIGYFTEELIPQIGVISMILASVNILSKSFFGLEIR